MRRLLKQVDEWNGEGILSIVGPTGSGKTSTALSVVKRFWPKDLKHPLLISLDSIAVYRECDIGSAKPVAQERDPYSWEGLDICAPDETMNVANFIRHVEAPMRSALAQSRPVILVGGSHFYERALVEGMPPGEASDSTYLSQLEQRPLESLWGELLQQDSRWATVLHPNDRYRIQRQLDLTVRQGLSFDQLRVSAGSSSNFAFPWGPVSTVILGLDDPADRIRSGLQLRIRSMMDRGWVEECRALARDFGPHCAPLSSVGYREIIQGENLTHEERETSILTAHLQLAKKQRTWLRGLLRRYSV